VKELKKTRINTKYLPGIVLPENMEFTSDISICSNADIIIMATPSHTIREVAKKLSTFVADGQIILSISKGFDTQTNVRLSEVIKEEIPCSTVAVMSGPSHAEEVAKGLPTTNVIACEDIKIAQYIQNIIISQVFRVYASDDVIGVELGGALKNIIALSAGISDGLGYGDNTKAALMTRGIAEIIRLGVAMGAKYETFAGLSGIGDLIVTCTSMHSRNRRAGILIGQGKTVDEAQREVKMVVEGVKAAKAAYELAKEYGVDMPITTEVYKIIYKNMSAKKCVNNLMCRKMKNETEKSYIFGKNLK
ncbi:MAG: NAD(P)-dependent glycerol-3-phosphate dehydrogenase, partial [Clostridia bacterium]|nr:NAD(P)-dependent glycerol-3-phosphate dehydrogenase [Clostridia bacterium]